MMKALIPVLLSIFIFGCSATPSGRVKVLNENVNIFVKSEDAWFDLMPPVDTTKENFRFLIETQINRLESSYIEIDTANFSVDNFVVNFDNYSYKSTNYTVIRRLLNASSIQIDIMHNLNAKYVNRAKTLPLNVYFSFDLNYYDEFLKRLETKKIQIKKVY